MSWGNKLLLAFIVFASGMGYLVYRSMNVNFELVDKNYYKNELRYQEIIDATNNVTLLSNTIKLTRTSNGILVELPDEMKTGPVEGEIFFYCAYDQQNDRKIKLQPSGNGTQLIPYAGIIDGNYIVKITWAHAGKIYFSQNNLTVN